MAVIIGQPSEIWNYSSHWGVMSDLAASPSCVFWLGKQGHLTCISALNGNVLWSYNTGNSAFDDEKSRLSSPTVHGDRVYIGGITSLNATNGKLLWKRNLPGTIQSSVGVTQDGAYALIGSIDGKIYAFDATNGSLYFQRQLTGRKMSPVVVHKFRQRFIAFVATQPSLTRISYEKGALASDKGGYTYAIDVHSGQTLWRFAPAPGTTFFGAPSSQPGVRSATPRNFTSSLIYVASFTAWTTQVHALHVNTGKEVWRYPAGGRVLSPPVVCPLDGRGTGSVYIAGLDGRVTSLYALTGKLRWAYTKEASISGSVVLDCEPRTPIARRELYVGNNIGTLHAVDRNTGVTRWTFHPREGRLAIFSTPVLLSAYWTGGKRDVVLGNLQGDFYRISGPGAEYNETDGSGGEDTIESDSGDISNDSGASEVGSDVNKSDSLGSGEFSSDGQSNDAEQGKEDEKGHKRDSDSTSNISPEHNGKSPMPIASPSPLPTLAPHDSPGPPTAVPTPTSLDTTQEGASSWLVFALFLLLCGMLAILYGHYKPRIVVACLRLRDVLPTTVATKVDLVLGLVQIRINSLQNWVGVTFVAVRRYFNNDRGLELAPLGRRNTSSGYSLVREEEDDGDSGATAAAEEGACLDDIHVETEDSEDDEEERLTRNLALSPPSNASPADSPHHRMDSSFIEKRARARSRSRSESNDDQLEEFYRPN